MLLMRITLTIGGFTLLLTGLTPTLILARRILATLATLTAYRLTCLRLTTLTTLADLTTRGLTPLA